jgi:hypothetical protein
MFVTYLKGNSWIGHPVEWSALDTSFAWEKKDNFLRETSRL